MINELPEVHPSLGHNSKTSVHLHGSASLPQFDGYASDTTRRGWFKDYEYPNVQHARTLWYHDHGFHHTAQNAYAGLYAQYHMHDRAELALLPQGEFDVPVTVADALFRANGALTIGDDESGLWGDVILVNGRPWPVMRVKRRIYRFRFLVASISRSYRFQLGNGDPVTVVATDGGLMPKARQVSQWRQSSAERYEVLIDFRRYRPGQRVVLRNLSNDNNRDFANTDQVMAFDVTDAPFSKRDHTWNQMPDTLVGSHVMRLKEADAKVTRRVRLERQSGIWTINGQTWEQVRDSEFQLLLADPKFNATEIWEISNPSGGWFHPFHIHLVDFRILSRNGLPPFDYERGPKDTAYIGRGGDGPAHHAVRSTPGSLHGPLPQPGPRGPRHDGAVRRRHGARRPGSERSDDRGPAQARPQSLTPPERRHSCRPRGSGRRHLRTDAARRHPTGYDASGNPATRALCLGAFSGRSDHPIRRHVP